jgi:uncharacterized protein (DUF2267 family)
LELSAFYARVAELLEPTVEADAAELTRAVLQALAERLQPRAARRLGRALPAALRRLLGAASGEGELRREQLLENVASRLDLDDASAEAGTAAVLTALRECVSASLPLSQVLEELPSDLQRLMT